MGKNLFFSIFLVLTLIFTGAASAGVLTFEGLAYGPVYNGYGGFNWYNLNASDLDDGGYGTVGSWYVFNPHAVPATISRSSTFDFNGASFVSAWYDALRIDVVGYRGGLAVYSSTIYAYTSGPAWFTFNWKDIDSLSISSSGGYVPPIYGDAYGMYHIFVMDNFTFDEPIVSKPVADAGLDQLTAEQIVVFLDGSASTDSSGFPLTYAWTQVAGPAVFLNTSPTNPIASFTAPGVPAGGATLTFRLVVNNGYYSSIPDTVNVTVKNFNHPPIADAGVDQIVNEESFVTLDASASYDPDAEPLTYQWVQISGPEAMLSDPTAVAPGFTAPIITTTQTMTFKVLVSDGIDSTSDTVNIVVENVNHEPVANAGDDQTKDEGSEITLDGSGSFDPDGDNLAYFWSQTGGTPVILSDPYSPTPVFAAPKVDLGGEQLTFTLVVSDGELDSVADEVVINILNVNDPPICWAATPSESILWPPNHKLVRIEITGVADPDDDDLEISITGVTQDEPLNDFGDGDTSPDAVINGDSVMLRVERTGDGNGRVYEISFTASDSAGNACSGSVTVGVPHDKKSTDCVDDGQFYDSTQP